MRIWFPYSVHFAFAGATLVGIDPGGFFLTNNSLRDLFLLLCVDNDGDYFAHLMK